MQTLTPFVFVSFFFAGFKYHNIFWLIFVPWPANELDRHSVDWGLNIYEIERAAICIYVVTLCRNASLICLMFMPPSHHMCPVAIYKMYNKIVYSKPYSLWFVLKVITLYAFGHFSINFDYIKFKKIAKPNHHLITTKRPRCVWPPQPWDVCPNT